MTGARGHSTTASTVIRSILALPELEMRVSWLRERLERRVQNLPLDELAGICDEIAARSQLSDRPAREALLALAVLLARLRDSSWVWALREQARSRSLINLERLLRPPHSGDVSLDAPEPSVPDYGGGRSLTVGERRTLARRPTRIQLERLLHDPHPLVFEQLLQCPTLTEMDVVAVATRRPVYVPALDLIVQSARWIPRRRIRMSLILNPGTPHGLALPFITTCPREDLRLIVGSTTVSTVLRSVAHELLQKLPPLRGSEPAGLPH